MADPYYVQYSIYHTLTDICVYLFIEYIYTVIVLCIDIPIFIYRHTSKTYIDIKKLICIHIHIQLGTDSHLQQISQQSQKGAILCYAKNILSLLCAGWGDPKPPSIF